MATGIVKRHSRRCRSRDGGRCNCDPTYEAWVYSTRDRKKVARKFTREAEAKSWRTDALAALARGTLRPMGRDARTLGEALRTFVDGMKAGTVRPKSRAAYKPNTIRSYERAVANYIEPSGLAAIKISEVRRADVQAFVDELLARGRAPASVSNILNPIQALYRRAIDRDEIAYNPAERIDLPLSGRQRPTRIASPSEAAALLTALPATDRPLWAGAFYAGLRRGELMALRSSDVDLGASVIHVERSWDQEEGPVDPKSASSRRTVPLLAVLRDHLDEHVIRTARAGDELVFGRTGAQPFAPMTVHKRARRLGIGPSSNRSPSTNAGIRSPLS